MRSHCPKGQYLAEAVKAKMFGSNDSEKNTAKRYQPSAGTQRSVLC